MHSDHPQIPDLQAVFDAALGFGLSEEEILQAVSATMLTVEDDATAREYMAELTECLSLRILWKERLRAPSRRRSGSLTGTGQAS